MFCLICVLTLKVIFVVEMGEPAATEEYQRALEECRRSILRCQAARKFVLGPHNVRAAALRLEEWRRRGNHGVVVPQETLERIAASSRRTTDYLISQHPWLESALNNEEASDDVEIVRVVPPPGNLPRPVPPPPALMPVELPALPYPSDVGSPTIVEAEIPHVVPGCPISSYGSS